MTKARNERFVVDHAVIVLGHEMNHEGEPDLIGRSRLLLASDIVRSDPRSILVTSGWAYRKDIDLSLAASMKRSAVRDLELDQKRIHCLAKSKDTVGDAVFFAEAVRAEKVTVVTSTFHQKRAERIFRFVLGADVVLDVLGTGQSPTPKQKANENQSLGVFRDTFDGIASGDFDAIRGRLKSAHPFYNGTLDVRALKRPGDRRLSCRPATFEDVKQLLEWRNAPEVRSASVEGEEISLATHSTWLRKSLSNPDRIILIFHNGIIRVGMVRFDCAEAQTLTTVSILLDPAVRGTGLAKSILKHAVSYAELQNHDLKAVARKENLPSIALFEGLGFEARTEGEFVELRRIALANDS